MFASASVAADVAVGFVSGILSGMFGIGGGIVTTPAIRLLLGYPALVAVGTPLLAILPTTLSGAWSYSRAHLVDVRAGVAIGLWGVPAAVVGALATRLVGGTVVLLLTAALIAYVAFDMLWYAWRSRDEFHPSPEEGEEPVLASAGRWGADASALDPAAGPPDTTAAPATWWRWAGLGLFTGLYSGFLGLGGGFVLVPLLDRRAHMPIKRAIGTSLVSISILAVPGIVTHWALGNIDVRLGLLLVVGSVPGALLGARITRNAQDRLVRVGFAVMLLAVGGWLAVAEILSLGR
jgi:uncharacterized membrane protein YfcA